jgi:hypothetical protein
VISSEASRIALLAVPTDEELMIARHTLKLIAADKWDGPGDSTRISAEHSP